MSLLAVKWYEYAGQHENWRQFWHDLSKFLPLNEPLQFHTGQASSLWAQGDYDMIWTCGGDIALNPNVFYPLVVPVFSGAPTSPGTYCSIVVQHVQSTHLPPGELRLGINGPASTSGHFALARWWRDQGFSPPRQVTITGGHEASVQALLNGEVDLISLDSQGWHLLQRAYEGLAATGHVVGYTQTLPAPPLCLPAVKADKDPGLVEAWRAGFAAAQVALSDGSLDDQGLRLSGFVTVNDASYADLRLQLAAQIAKNQLLTPLP